MGQDLEMKEYVVCFLDIMGYSEFVENNTKQIDKIIQAKKALNSVLEHKDNMLDADIEIIKKVYSVIDINIMSDSIIICMPLENLGKITGFDDNVNIFTYIFIYLYLIGEIYRIIAWKMGCLLRGAIVKGSHLQSNLQRPENLFIFSPALCRSVKLEKKAGYPRVLFDDSLFLFINQIPLDKSLPIYKQMFEYLVFNDHTGLRCLDIYPDIVGRLERNDTIAAWQLFEICENIETQINNHRVNPDILEKYAYFATYHNSKFSKRSEFGNFIISLENKTPRRMASIGKFGTLQTEQGS